MSSSLSCTRTGLLVKYINNVLRSSLLSQKGSVSVLRSASSSSYHMIGKHVSHACEVSIFFLPCLGIAVFRFLFPYRKR
jgi:hypothetical protein